MNDCDKNMSMNQGAPVSWCVVPWSRVSIKTNGNYRLCCSGETNTQTGDNVLRDKNRKPLHIGSADWESVMNSSTMKSVRKNMLKGKWSAECVHCERLFKKGGLPYSIGWRLTLASVVETENYPGYVKAKTLTQKDGSISLKDFPISDVDIRFGNLCNLKCVMCGPRSSDKWYDDYRLIWGKDYFLDQEEKVQLKSYENGKWKAKEDVFNWSEDLYLQSQFKENVSSFKRIYIAGGEPLLIKAHYKFLKWCVLNDVAKRIVIKYSSNITHIPTQAWDLWKHFKLMDMNISLDGFGPVNNFIRYPSEWNKIEKNLKKFDVAKGHFNLNILTTMSVLNVWHLPEFINYIMRENYKQISKQDNLLWYQPVRRPYHLDMVILEDSFKEKISSHFEKAKKRISNFDWQAAFGDSNLQSWEDKIKRADCIMDKLIKYMHNTHYDEKEFLLKHRKRFIYFMDKLDTLRGLCWAKTFPELYESTLGWRNL